MLNTYDSMCYICSELDCIEENGYLPDGTLCPRFVLLAEEAKKEVELPKDYVTVTEAAKIAGVTRAVVQGNVKRGKLHSFGGIRGRYVCLSDVLALTGQSYPVSEGGTLTNKYCSAHNDESLTD